MNESSDANPTVLVSQVDRGKREPPYRFSAPDFVLVLGSTIQLWVNDVHFIQDREGNIREGQYFLVKDADFGVTVSRIESVDGEETSAQVRHEIHWNDGELAYPDTTEIWTEKEIIGSYNRAMGDESRSVFLRRTDESESCLI